MSIYYKIENTQTATILGTYEGETEDDALDAMARDAGYSDYEAALALNGHAGDNLLITVADSKAIEDES